MTAISFGIWYVSSVERSLIYSGKITNLLQIEKMMSLTTELIIASEPKQMTSDENTTSIGFQTISDMNVCRVCKGSFDY